MAWCPHAAEKAAYAAAKAVADQRKWKFYALFSGFRRSFAPG